MSFLPGQPNRRSLRERLRDGLQQTIPFQSKSRSVDSNQQLQFPTTLDDLISLNPFKDGSTPPPQGPPSSTSPSPLHPTLLLEDAPKEHVVRESETITSIAASYDVTPSELLKCNRLSARVIFPGQVLKIPPRRGVPVVEAGGGGSLPKTPPVYQRKFIKIHVRHITDGNGVVAGTLLVTPNAVMFDPNVSDPLVLDQGAESYGVILPLEVIVSAGIYSDIAHMQVEGKEYTSDVKPVLYPDTLQDETVPPSSEVQPNAGGGVPESGGGGGGGGGVVLDHVSNDSGFDTGTRQSPTPPLAPTNITPTPSNISTPNNTTIPHPLQSPSSSGSGGGESRKNKVLKRLSFPLAWMDSLSGNGNDGGGHGNKEETQSAPPESKVNYRSLVSLEDMPDLFASFDKLLPFGGGGGHGHSCGGSTISHYPLSSSSADYYDSPPWYLCLTTGYPKGKKLKPGLVVSYGQKKCLKPEYWFGVPRSQVGDLYNFWMLWWPHLYGDVDEKVIDARGYQLVKYDSSEIFREDEQPLESLKGELNELTKESWEVVSMSEELRKALYGSEEYVPELLGKSEIFGEDDVKIIARHLSARAEGYPWLLVFSTSRNGFSLNTLYRKMEELEESPVLIVIEDTKGRVFGSLVSTPLRVSDHFYGTGQSFLFRLKPEFELFKWTGENMYFIKGNTESLSIGAGDGRFGLWFDGDLNVGRTDSCGTYGNPPLVDEKDFVVKTIECWAFGGMNFESR